MNQNLNTFSIQNKFVEPIFAKIKKDLNQVVTDIQIELENEREMKEAERELKRTENLIKYKDEIKSRPQKEWFQSNKRKETVKKEAKENLKDMKKNFEDQLGKGFKKKREAKQELKEQTKAAKDGSKFSQDREASKKKPRYGVQ